MTESGPIVPGEFAGHVQGHVTLCEEYDHAQHNAKQIAVLGRGIPNGITPPEIPSLISQSDPPQEIQAAVQNLKRELQEASQLQKAIEAGNQEIVKIERRFRAMLLGGGLVLVILFIAAMAWITY